MICYARLPLAHPITTIRKELLRLPDNWRLHLNTHHYQGEWTVLPLMSPGGQPENVFADLNTHGAYAETPDMKHFPAVRELLSTLKCEKMSVRFMKLKAGSVIKAHRDHDLSFEMGEARLHFPIVTNEQVDFRIEEERIVMEEGSCWYINANLPHSVANNGSADRVHLVVDCKVNDWLTGMMERSERKTRTAVSTSSDTVKIIEELRRQNTPTSLQLADQLEKSL